MRIIQSALIAMVLCGAIPEATARGPYCSGLRASMKPTEPFCATDFMEFTSQSDFDICKMNVQTYLNEMANYQKCLSEETDKVVKQFNCKARKESFCP